MRANPIAICLRTAVFAGLLVLPALALGQVEQQVDLSHRGNSMETVTSKDGTAIAYERVGNGPSVILVGGALSGREGGSELAKLLSPHFTVYSYDRRGRGDSGDTKPYAVQREIEDIAALLDAAGGAAFVYGKSSGAALALEAAASLGDKVKKLAIYEAPYSEAAGAAGEWKQFRSRLDGMLASDRREEAVTAFMKFVGAPETAIAGMKASPAWKGMVAMAPTLAYDNAILGEDRSVPVVTAAKVTAPALIMDGGASAGPMPFMRPTADKIAKAIPGAKRGTIAGQAHDVSAKSLAPVLREFFD